MKSIKKKQKQEYKKTGAKILEVLKKILHSKEFIEKHKVLPQHFTRKRVLIFPVMFSFLVNLVCRTLQVELDECLGLLGENKVTKQAFFKGRKKLKETAFIHLKDELVREFYKTNDFKTYKGYILIAGDGTTLQLPGSEEIEEEFGHSKNQKGAAIPMARASAFFDPLNEITIDALIDRYKSDERSLCIEHIVNCNSIFDQTQKKLLLLDMGYPALYLLFYLQRIGYDFVIRCNPTFLKEVQQVIVEGVKDIVLEIPLSRSWISHKRLETLLPEVKKEEKVRFRVVTVMLDDGTEEYLLTSLFDTVKFPRKEFKKIYNFRWGVETNYDLIKNILLIEEFTGKTALSIKQDFHATIFSRNVLQLAVQDAKEKLDKKNASKTLKYKQKINNNISTAKLKNTIVKLLLEGGDIMKLYEELTNSMLSNPNSIRPNRKNEHPKGRSRKKNHMGKKRAI